ncbi:MerR family transcriptional regulator [Kitasatospora kazusensis]|uniref:MerR family transcriptional regulator n=1 Tax=Kitasatospora kazusensis TaxID=407974 RepID=A0ABN2ZPC4_9ACTN
MSAPTSTDRTHRDDGTASGDRPLSIGELAEAAGVSVKTVRFYSDSGLLPESGRSAGGHRRYGRPALERLLTVRRLRALGVALPAIAELLREETGLDGVLARQRAELARQLTELRWREASLSALTEVGGDPALLPLLGEALRSTPATDTFVEFWRRILPLRLPRRLTTSIIDASVPDLPADPTPAQAVAYARLHALTADRAVAAGIRNATAGFEIDFVQFYEGLGEAYALTTRHLLAGTPPGPGDALDCFVGVYARAKHRADTPAFRRTLAHRPALAADHEMAAYWSHSAELRPAGDPDMGAAEVWLTAALAAAQEREHPAGSAR